MCAFPPPSRPWFSLTLGGFLHGRVVQHDVVRLGADPEVDLVLLPDPVEDVELVLALVRHERVHLPRDRSGSFSKYVRWNVMGRHPEFFTRRLLISTRELI